MSTPTPKRAALVLLTSLVVFAGSAGCAGPADPDEVEVISRVVLTFTPVAGGDPLVFSFEDPDGDGGVSGIAEPITLPVGQEFELDLEFIDTLRDPSEDITEEVEAEAEEHLVFVYGTAIAGPASSTSPALATHAYADLESDYGPNLVDEDLPVGLRNTLTTTTTGAGTLRVVLRHLPDLNGEAQKTAELPASFAAGELLPGEVDVDVSFELTVE